MKRLLMIWLCLLPLLAAAQSDQHYTMFMYNKLLYNPGYTGSRDVLSVNAQYRNQWSNVPGAPKTVNLTIDGAAGSYMRPVRKVALGFSFTNEEIGVESNTHLRAYYAYRIKWSKYTLSMGLNGGGTLYSARYSDLNAMQANDPNLVVNVQNALLPNFGTGVYWSCDQYYAGISLPNLLQNTYDNNGTRIARQVRGYYLSGGYVFPINETIQLKPQALVRLAGNGKYKLPVNADINLSAIAYDRLMLGVTYRTDKSLAVIAHIQVTRRINLGYAYDHLMSDFAPYGKGAHEFAIGYDFVRDITRFVTPRFIRKF